MMPYYRMRLKAKGFSCSSYGGKMVGKGAAKGQNSRFFILLYMLDMVL